MNKRILEYIIKVLFQDWRTFEGVSGILVGAFAYFTPNALIPEKVRIFIYGFILIFILKLLKQFFKYFINFYHPVKVLRKVQGDGAYTGIDVIVMENQENVSIGLLMTLFCVSSGAEQPVCILEILSCEKGEDIIAKQLIPSSEIYSIDKYFDEESRRKSLYARTLVNGNTINSFQKIKS